MYLDENKKGYQMCSRELTKRLYPKGVPGEFTEGGQTVDILVIGEPKNETHLCAYDRVVNERRIKKLVMMGRSYKKTHPQQKLACLVVADEITQEALILARKCKIKTYSIRSEKEM